MEEKNKKIVLLKLFISTLYLSTFTFGGGYVIVTLMKKKFVDEYHWIEENEMLDLVAIAQSSPWGIFSHGALPKPSLQCSILVILSLVKRFNHIVSRTESPIRNE